MVEQNKKMSQFKKVISLKKVIRNSLGKNKSEKYLKGIEVIFSNTLATNSMDIYQYALTQLLEGDTEKAINCIIFALDYDRENKLALHLCKTMLLGLTQYMADPNVQQTKQKYADNVDESVTRFKKKVKELEKIIGNEEKELEKLQKELMRNRRNLIFSLFKSGKLKKKIQELKTVISTYNDEFDTVKNELNKLEDLVQREESIKVVGLIIEVCVFPSRFDPDLMKTHYM